MTGTQQPLFEADKARDEHVKVCAEIRDSAEVIRSSLKECAGHVALLKDGPKAVQDILFRCQATALAADHLKLLGEQATELGGLYEKLQKETAKMLTLERRRDELGKEMAANGMDVGNETEVEPDDEDGEDGDDDGMVGAGNGLKRAGRPSTPPGLAEDML